MENKREYAIDIAKGIAIFLVVFGHVIQYTIAPTGRDFFMNPLFEAIYSFHMPLFMFISGYLSVYSIRRRSPEDNIKGKFKGLLKPYVIWTFVVSAVMVLFNVLDGVNYSVMEVGKLVVSNLVVSPYIWFLPVLFIFYAMLYATVELKKKIGNFAFVLSLVILYAIPINRYFGIYYIQFFYLFFLVGYLANPHHPINRLEKLGKGKTAVLALLGIVLYLWLLSYWDRDDYIYINLMQFDGGDIISGILSVAYRYLIGFVGIGLTIILSWFLQGNSISEIFRKLGHYTLDIYLIQNILVSLGYKELIEDSSFALRFNGIGFILFCALIAILSIYVCVAIAKWMKQRNHQKSNLELRKFKQ